MGTLLEIIHYGEPVPALRARMTRGRPPYTPPKYADYKRALAAAISRDYGHWAAEIPGQDRPKERLKFFKNNRYALMVDIYRPKRRGDVDNYLKCVQDSLQQAGVIGNDSQIYAVTAVVWEDKANPRLEIRLTREVLG
jgi:Holliday junction resolvase RusA-like endonuclease